MRNDVFFKLKIKTIEIGEIKNVIVLRLSTVHFQSATNFLHKLNL